MSKGRVHMLFLRIATMSIAAILILSISPQVQPVIADTPESMIVGGSNKAVSRIHQIDEIALGLQISTNEAHSRFQGQSEFLAAVNQGIEAFPESFFSSGWTPERLESNGYKSWVSFTPDTHVTVVDLFKDLPYPVEVRFDAPMSADAAEEVRHVVMSQLFREIEGLVGLVGDFTEDGRLVVSYEMAHGSFTNGGDSGGPWWSNGKAIGIHFGKSGGYSTMSRVPDVQAILSVQVAHS